MTDIPEASAGQAPPPPPPPPPWAHGFTTRYGLVRPRNGRYLAGVCAAIARATNTDPVLWRVLLAVLGFFFGIGILVYVAAWLVIPAEGDTASPVEALLGKGRSSMSPVTVIILSVAVVVLFGIIVTDGFRALLLGAAILIGGALLLNRNSNNASGGGTAGGAPPPAWNPPPFTPPWNAPPAGAATAGPYGPASPYGPGAPYGAGSGPGGAAFGAGSGTAFGAGGPGFGPGGASGPGGAAFGAGEPGGARSGPGYGAAGAGYGAAGAGFGAAGAGFGAGSDPAGSGFGAGSGPGVDDPTTGRPTTDDPGTDDPGTGRPTTNGPTTDGPTTDSEAGDPGSSETGPGRPGISDTAEFAAADDRGYPLAASAPDDRVTARIPGADAPTAGQPPAGPSTPPLYTPGPYLDPTPGGYRPPFAPRGPYGGPPPSPPPAPPMAKPPKPPKERSALGAATFSLIPVVIGLVAMADLMNMFSVKPSTYFAAILAVIALGLLVGTWLGRARWLIFLGLAMAAAVGISTIAEHQVSHDGNRGRDVVWQPATIDGLRNDYRIPFGEATLDLTAVDFTGQSRDVSVNVNVGELTVLLPPNVDVSARVDVDAGDARVFEERISGFGQPAVDVTDLGEDGAGGGNLRLLIHVNTGDVEVTR